MKFKTVKRIAIFSALAIGIACLFLFYEQHQKSKYVEYVAVVDDAATSYADEYAYFFFSIDDKQDMHIGSVSMMVPRLGAFGGVHLEESNPSFLETCRRYSDHEDPIAVHLSKNRIDYNRPENLRYRKLFLKDSHNHFYVAHMKLEETTTADEIRDVRHWRLTQINTNAIRKYILRGSELETSELKLQDSNFRESLPLAIRNVDASGRSLPGTFPKGICKSPPKK